MTSQKLNQKQARWALYLSQFNFILIYIPGKSMGKANRLSRRPDWQKGVEKDNEDQIVITSKLFLFSFFFFFQFLYSRLTTIRIEHGKTSCNSVTKSQSMILVTHTFWSQSQSQSQYVMRQTHDGNNIRTIRTIGGHCIAIIVKCISSVENQIETLLSSPCQLRLGVDLSHLG